MNFVREADENEMILAFLKGEIDSPRFGPHYMQILTNSRLDRSVVDKGNLDNPQENSIRSQLLGLVRGYGRNAYLFAGFPKDVKWQRVILTKPDFDRLLYANHQTWVQLSSGSRLVKDGVKNINSIAVGENANENILAVAKAIKGGNTYAELIIVDVHGKLVLIEGHARATAYYLVEKPLEMGIEALVGFSTAMANWAFA